MSQIRPVQADIEASLAPRRLARNMVLLVSGAILALVTITTFATFSRLLKLRSGELAIRQALGETPAGLARRALRSALWVTAIAAVLGLALYIPASRASRGLVFGVVVLNAGVLFGSFLAIGGLALAAAAAAVGLTVRRQVTGLARLLGQA